MAGNSAETRRKKAVNCSMGGNRVGIISCDQRNLLPDCPQSVTTDLVKTFSDRLAGSRNRHIDGISRRIRDTVRVLMVAR